MPVIESHVIGTMAVIMFSATLIVFLNTVVSNENMSLASNGLKVISDTTALRAVELISMANMSNTQCCIQSSLNLPTTIADKGYWISLSSAGGYMVVASTSSPPNVSVKSMMPLNSTSVNIQVVSTNGLIVYGVMVEQKVYGGDMDAVLWAMRIGNTIQIGLGRIPR
jgi:hypothetical protein